MGTFFHLFSHDVDGPLGNFLRSAVYTIVPVQRLPDESDLDDKTFAMLATGMFMQVTGILMLPAPFFGPSFSIFITPFSGIIQTGSSIVSSFYRRVEPFPSEKDFQDGPKMVNSNDSNYAPNTNKGKKKKKKKTA